MGIKSSTKRIADSRGKPDRRQRDNKKTPGNTTSLKPQKHKKRNKREIKKRAYNQMIKSSLCADEGTRTPTP